MGCGWRSVTAYWRAVLVSYLFGMLAVIVEGFDLGERDDGYGGARSEDG